MGILRGKWYTLPCSPARAHSNALNRVKNGPRVRKIDKELESSGIRLARTLTMLWKVFTVYHSPGKGV